MKEHSSAITRFTVTVRHIWQEGVRAHEALLARPWETEGDLRWVRDLGGRRLAGRELPAGGEETPAPTGQPPVRV